MLKLELSNINIKLTKTKTRHIHMNMASFSLTLLFHLSCLFNTLSAKHTSDSNPRLRQAFTALQAWKNSIYSDPNNFTSNWAGPMVCRYSGVFCAPAPHDNRSLTVAGIDLNGKDIAGFLPEELGLLSDLALIHLNSNRFCGQVPRSLSNLSLLYEIDLSNNRFVGPFPPSLLSLPSLNYLDLRFNEFEGPVPPQVFVRGLDAVFLNNNRFTALNFLPPGGGAAGAARTTVLVLANNNYGSGGGSNRLSPAILSYYAATLEELVITNSNLSGCLPEEVGLLYKLRLLDLSSNAIEGLIPYSAAGMYRLERFNVGHNRMTGVVPEGICTLPNLSEFTISYNFFCEESTVCTNLTAKKGFVFDDRRNCLPERPFQRTKKACQAALEKPPPDCLDVQVAAENSP